MRSFWLLVRRLPLEYQMHVLSVLLGLGWAKWLDQVSSVVGAYVSSLHTHTHRHTSILPLRICNALGKSSVCGLHSLYTLTLREAFTNENFQFERKLVASTTVKSTSLSSRTYIQNCVCVAFDLKKIKTFIFYFFVIKQKNFSILYSSHCLCVVRQTLKSATEKKKQSKATTSRSKKVKNLVARATLFFCCFFFFNK